VGNIVNVKVVDHLIITTKEYFGFERSGLMNQLRMSKKYVLAFLEEARLKKEFQQIGEVLGEKKGLEKGIKKGLKEGEKKKAVEMAKMMKKESESVEKISKYTGLPQEEIEKL
jgi:DNA repair protein RadC